MYLCVHARVCMCGRARSGTRYGVWKAENAPPNISGLNLWNLKYYLIFFKNVFADVIKLRILRWSDHLGLSGGP